MVVISSERFTRQPKGICSTTNRTISLLLASSYQGLYTRRTTKHEKLRALVFILTGASMLFIFFSYRDNFQITKEGAQNTVLIYERNHWDENSPPSTLHDPNPDIGSPRVAWLMSYPNSGTSYTMKLVTRASNKTVATNYGKECDFNDIGENTPLYPHSPNGPYLLQPSKKLPEHYIMTKTHCGGKCNECGPGKYLETKESFLDECASGSHLSSTDPTKQLVQYDPKLVQRAIHLIRNPFNNIVSNFHLEQHEKIKKNRTSWLLDYPNNVNGFRKWCTDVDAQYAEEEEMSRLIPTSVIALFADVPCHKAFYAFAQWHNLAIRVIADLQLPSLIIHYEDYETRFDATTKRIFDFLELSPVGAIPPFFAGKQYFEFFSHDEREAAKKIVERIADGQTWNLVQRYFE